MARYRSITHPDGSADVLDLDGRAFAHFTDARRADEYVTHLNAEVRS